jgi:hypothetical protein
MAWTVSLIGRNSYSGFINWVGEDEPHLNSVHIAAFDHPVHGKCEAYVKMFPYEQGRNRGLINEITGYLFAHAAGIPQPEIAFVAEIPIGSIPNKPKWLDGIDFYPAFCTKRMDAKAAAYRLPKSKIPRLIKSVQKWDHFPSTVCIDECSSNTDRHLNNLLKTGKHTYAVIDADRIAALPTQINWTKETLNHDMLYENRLSEIIWNHKPKDKHVSQMLSNSSAISSSFSIIEDEINYWSGMLLNIDDKSAFTQFLNNRSSKLDFLLRQRYNRLL